MQSDKAIMEERRRDFIGYGNHPPKVVWPGRARLAINFVVNYEEGSERNILDGDPASEDYLTDLPGVAALPQRRHLSSESMFEYGSRVGIWRLIHLFEDYQVPLTIFTTGLALERNPPLSAYLKNNHHEIVGHGYRWINYREIPVEQERTDLQRTLTLIKALTGKEVCGWYTGRSSQQTRELIVEAGLQYDSESYNDDLPYWTIVNKNPHLVIPYTFDTNDARYATVPGFNTSLDFLNYLIATFDCLFREGKDRPKMMTVALHARLSGHPGRAEVIKQFLDYVRKKQDTIWICRRNEIANFWAQHHPYS